MQSPYKSYNPKKPQMILKDLKRPHMTSKDSDEVDKRISKKVKTKKNSRGDDLSDNHNDGRDFIEQAFSSN